jgi:hypothetical protein
LRDESTYKKNKKNKEESFRSEKFMAELLKKMSWTAEDMESGVSIRAQWGEYMYVCII